MCTHNNIIRSTISFIEPIIGGGGSSTIILHSTHPHSRYKYVTLCRLCVCVCRRRWYARLVGPRYGCRCNGQSAVYLLDYYRTCLCVCLVTPSDGPPSIGGSHSYFLDVTPFRTTTIIISYVVVVVRTQRPPPHTRRSDHSC